MSLVEDVTTAIRNHNAFVKVLRRIANEQLDAETMRVLARNVLDECAIRQKDG